MYNLADWLHFESICILYIDADAIVGNSKLLDHAEFLRLFKAN